MERVAFIGSYDKTDMLLMIARALVIAGKKVLLVDSTALQKSRYIVPAMKQRTPQYITRYENIDVAEGFISLQDLNNYYVQTEGKQLDYDFLLLDIDSAKGYVGFHVDNTVKQFFVTSIDNYCLKRGLLPFLQATQPVEVTRVIFSRNMMIDEIKYLSYLSQNLKIKWNNETIYFPFENGDQTTIFDNQRTGLIRTKGLTNQYTDALKYLAEHFVTDIKPSELSKAFKALDRE